MKEKYGPLEAWQWGLIIVAVGLLWFYEKKKSGSEVLNPSESFATGNPVEQGASGTTGSSSEAPEVPLPREMPEPLFNSTNQTESEPAPGLGAGQLFATELGEVAEGRNALEKSGLFPPVQALHPRTTKKKIKPKTHSAKRKKPTHAKQGSHHHAAHAGHGHHPTHHPAHHPAHAVAHTGGTPAPKPHQGHPHKPHQGHPHKGSAHHRRRK